MKNQSYFDGCNTQEEASKRLKSLSKKFHPDKEGGNQEIMTEINREYGDIKKNIKKRQEAAAKKLEVFDWVRQKGLSGIETNQLNIKEVTMEGVAKILNNVIPDEKKTLRKIATNLINEEIKDFDLVEFSRNMFEKAEKILKLDK